LRTPISLRFALRDLRSGLSGLYILIACIVLGVTAIAAIGSLSKAVEEGLEREGQPLLGGDIEIAVVHRQLPPEELKALARWGVVSEVATLRAMAAGARHHALIEIKAVDPYYPLYGRVELSNGQDLDEILAFRRGWHGAAVDPLLLSRLGLAPGDEIRIGEAAFELRAAILREPDRIADSFALGPRVLMTRQALALTGLVKPGSLISWRYRLKLDDPLAYKDIAETIKRDFPDRGWRVRTRSEAAPGISRYLERLTFFLTLVGMTSLVIGGVGIANAVKIFIDRRRRQIAILRLLGASRAMVFSTCLWEVMLIASLAVVIGVTLGALLPWVIDELLGGLLPLPLHIDLYWTPLALGAVVGLLTALVFSIWPLAQAKDIGPLELIRRAQAQFFHWPKPFDFLLIALATTALIATAFIGFDEGWMMLWYVLGLGGSFVLLLALGMGLVVLARRIGKPANATLRFAVANLYRPGTALPSIVLSLGLGLTLFVTLSLVDRSLTNELRSHLPANAPSYFFLDVAQTEKERFLRALGEETSITAIATAPMLRGRITRVKETPAGEVKAGPEGAWALRGDRGLTYADEVPQGSHIVEGRWWPKNYSGPPLVSFTEDVARAIGLNIGDSVSVNVLGRELTATVASLRRVDWRSLGMNFVMVFSPGTLSKAPHSNLVTVSLDPEREAPFLDRIAAAFPTVTAIRVKDALDAVGDILAKLLLAIRSANILTIITGLLVLGGALATGLSARTYDAVVLKTYGATRRQLVGIFAIEFLISGLATAVFAILMGSLAALALTRWVLEIPFDFSIATALLSTFVSMGLAVIGGLLSAWTALGASPAAHLRND
jgi:putative ABC transport system permease protein